MDLNVFQNSQPRTRSGLLNTRWMLKMNDQKNSWMILVFGKGIKRKMQSKDIERNSGKSCRNQQVPVFPPTGFEGARPLDERQEIHVGGALECILAGWAAELEPGAAELMKS